MAQKPLPQRFSRPLRVISIAVMALTTTACGKSFQAADLSSKLTENVQDTLTCKDSRSQIFDAYYRAYQNQAEVVGPNGVAKLAALDDTLDFAPGTSKEIKTAVKNIHTLLTTELENLPTMKVSESSEDSNEISNETPEDEARDPILKLIRLEMGSRIDPEYEVLNTKLEKVLAEAQGEARLAKLDCNPVVAPPPSEQSTSPTATPIPESNVSRLPAALAGARSTMATAYQSCASVKLPSMTAAVEDLQGVERTTKVDSVGWGRGYTNVSLLKKTHYYIQGQTYGSGCTNLDKTPMVYDYGGRPVVKSSSQISLFENSGGGKALGIDCSAFVSSAVGVAGLRYKTGSENKPVYTRYVSRDFISAKTSNWSCYDNVTVSKTSSIKSGDIVAVVGHVVMVDDVSSDPFGLAKIKSSSGCSSISYRNFDFSVIQSSPSKNSIGINRYEARDYLSESSKMQAVFVAYAKAECKAKFGGAASNPSTSSFGIIRHKGTSSCKAPALTIVGQSCIKNCSLD